MLREENKKEIQNRLSKMIHPVRLKFFTQQTLGDCQFCRETEQLLKEVTELSSMLSFEVHNFVVDKDLVDQYRIDKIPATVIEEEKDLGIRFYGIPAGYEFATLLEMIMKMSARNSGMTPDLKELIQKVKNPVHIQVFVTPTCPYCSKAAITACQMAMEHELITADIVEISEFPHFAQKYGVMTVPKIVMNETSSFEGALSEAVFIEHVLNIASAAS